MTQTEKPKSIVIDGVEYVPKSTLATREDGLDYVIIRADRAGVFAGYLAKREHDEVLLKDARRIWYWVGAASLSQLALDGTSNPSGCKFPAAVPEITVLGVIEVIPVTEKAKASIASVKEWKQ